MDLRAAVLNERLASYADLRGGYPFPLAGAIYWFALAGLGFAGLPLGRWILCAAYGSGLIFPLAMLLGKLLRCDFIKRKTAVTSVLVPAFVAMFLFWPMAFAAWLTAPDLVPLIIAIGMSLHWPAIGWMYARTALYAAHAVVRAGVCFGLWMVCPDHRFTLIPVAVGVIYVITVIAILIDSAVVRRRIARAMPVL
jgi:hypothetical protein